jgi:hypothetical protein
VGLETEKGTEDMGLDRLMKNDREATMRLKTGEGDFEREREKTAVEELM